MSPASITKDAAASASPTTSTTPAQLESSPESMDSMLRFPMKPPAVQNFDDIFHNKFMQIIQQFRDNPHSGALTQKDRKAFIDTAYAYTDDLYFGNRSLTDHEIKMRAMTKVFYKVLAEEPWSDEWIRPHDVERKLSRFEMHKDSVELARQHGIYTPREAIAAARRHEISLSHAVPNVRMPRGPWDEIEIIYIPGTVSSHATSAINRDTTYPISAASVAHTLHKHICRDMVRPYAMAEMFVTCADTKKLTELKAFAENVCDFAPHLLDNDNVSLVIVLLILTRSEICRRFSENGIRIEGSTISHRRASCLKDKLGWKNSDERKPFDNVAQEFQTRLKNACNPAPRAHRPAPRKNVRKSSTAATPSTPPIGYYGSPQVRNSMPSASNTNANTGINIPAPNPPLNFYGRPRNLDPDDRPSRGSFSVPAPPALKQAQGASNAASKDDSNSDPEAMDTS